MKILNFLLLLSLSFSSMANENDDPWETLNRSTFEFNQTIDENILEPIAKTYQESVPESAQNRVSDFSSNIGDISTLGNELVQFELVNSVNTLGRILLNSTVGLFGLFDVASEIGMTKTTEDFGQTLAVWGAPKGPYLVLPIFGPSTVRDGVGVVADSAQRSLQTQPLTSAQKLTLTGVQAVDIRTKLLPVTDLLKQAEDPYARARSAYLQKREYDINNGDLEDEF